VTKSIFARRLFFTLKKNAKMQRCFFARRVWSVANTSLYENQQKYLKTDSENVTKTERRFSRSISTTSPTRGIEKKCENARLQFRYPFLDISVGFHIDLCLPRILS